MMMLRHFNNKQSSFNQANRHRSILIIGEGYTDYKLNQINRCTSSQQVFDDYGQSELLEAFNIAYSFDIKDIFVANIKRKLDYIEFADVLKHYDFTYIVPLSVHFSDTFFNPLINREMTYSELYLDIISDYNQSYIVMTDNHASLYEDVDDFLDDMTHKINQFKNIAQSSLRNGRNLCMVTNNLVNSQYANLMLACSLCVCNYDSYPSYDFGPTIFDIDDFDINANELIYFKNSPLLGTTIENLKNFRIENDAAKIITIDMVIKFIEREMDFSEYKGKVFTEYLRLRLYSDLSKFFQSILNTVIRGYKINSVDFIKVSSGVGVIVNNFSITPINSIEDFDIVMEV